MINISITIMQCYTRKYHKVVAVCIVTSARQIVASHPSAKILVHLSSYPHQITYQQNRRILKLIYSVCTFSMTVISTPSRQFCWGNLVVFCLFGVNHPVCLPLYQAGTMKYSAFQAAYLLTSELKPAEKLTRDAYSGTTAPRSPMCHRACSGRSASATSG